MSFRIIPFTLDAVSWLPLFPEEPCNNVRVMNPDANIAIQIRQVSGGATRQFRLMPLDSLPIDSFTGPTAHQPRYLPTVAILEAKAESGTPTIQLICA